MKKILTFAVVGALGAFFIPLKLIPTPSLPIFSPQEILAVAARTTTSPFVYNFGSNGTVEETGSIDESASPYFWINSGGRLVIENGVGKTVQGPLKAGDRWQLLYGASNPLDTDRGFYPQNIFRLLTRSTWNNVTQEVRFKLDKINMTNTPNRDGYSGLLLFNRYRDGDNLYYSGIRMDGTAIVKKKVKGTYYTLASSSVFKADSGYERNTNPNLIPGNRWMKLKNEVRDLPNGDVSITLWVDKNDSGGWTQVLNTVDKTGLYGGSDVIKGSGYAGIRSDYLDLSFDDYKLVEIPNN